MLQTYLQHCTEADFSIPSASYEDEHSLSSCPIFHPPGLHNSQHQSESELKLNLDLREYSGGWMAIVAHSVTGVIWMVGQ